MIQITNFNTQPNSSIRNYITVMLIVLFTGASFSVIACSCRPPAPLTEAVFMEADLVFTGIASQVSIDKVNYIRVITFEIKEGIKAHGMSSVVVTTAADGAACGINVSEGEEWYIWARKNRDGDGYSTGLCSRSVRLIKEAPMYMKRYEEDMAVINAFKAKKGYQKLNLSQGTAEGKMKKGKQCGKWKYFDANGVLVEECKFKKGIKQACTAITTDE